MMLVEETTVALAALPMAQFRTHLRLGSGFAEDSLQDGVLESFLRAAIAAVEARTGKVLLEREYGWTLTEGAARHVFPVAPVTAIVSVSQLDAEGGATLVGSDRYRLVPDGQTPHIEGVAGPMPDVPFGGNLVIRFLAGFGPEWSDLPADLAQAVLMLAAHYYEFRHETALGAGCMPFGVTALIERYRNIRLFGDRS